MMDNKSENCGIMIAHVILSIYVYIYIFLHEL